MSSMNLRFILLWEIKKILVGSAEEIKNGIKVGPPVLAETERDGGGRGGLGSLFARGCTNGPH